MRSIPSTVGTIRSNIPPIRVPIGISIIPRGLDPHIALCQFHDSVQSTGSRSVHGEEVGGYESKCGGCGGEEEEETGEWVWLIGFDDVP